MKSPRNSVKDEEGLIPTRASLLSRLKDCQDEASRKIFFDTYRKRIYKAAIKAYRNAITLFINYYAY